MRRLKAAHCFKWFVKSSLYCFDDFCWFCVVYLWGRHSIYYGAANVRRTGDNISHFLFSPLIETRQFSLARQLSRVRGVTSNTDTFSGFISVGKEKETQRHLFFWLVLREKEPGLGPLVLHLVPLHPPHCQWSSQHPGQYLEAICKLRSSFPL